MKDFRAWRIVQALQKVIQVYGGKQQKQTAADLFPSLSSLVSAESAVEDLDDADPVASHRATLAALSRFTIR